MAGDKCQLSSLEGENRHRAQPVLVERHFSSEFSGMVEGSVYYITLKTPLASKAVLGTTNNMLNTELRKIHGQYRAASTGNELVQLAIDSEKENSQFYLHFAKQELQIPNIYF